MDVVFNGFGCVDPRLRGDDDPARPGLFNAWKRFPKAAGHFRHGTERRIAGQTLQDPGRMGKMAVRKFRVKRPLAEDRQEGLGHCIGDLCPGLDVALCHGWIDGQKKGFDEQFFLQRFTPRRPRSLWSKINIGHVERLIAAGLMQPRGLREVEAARADGRWEAAYHGFSVMEVPADLAAALKKSRKAQAFFDTLDRTNRYAFCWRVHTAKKPETRVARAAKFVEMLTRGEKIH